MGCTGFYWVSTGLNLILLDLIRWNWVLLGFHWVHLGFIEFYWVVLGFTGFYWVLLGFTGFYWVLLGFLSAFIISFVNGLLLVCGMNGKRGLVVLGGPIGTAETGCGDRVLFFGFSKTVLFDFFGSIF